MSFETRRDETRRVLPTEWNDRTSCVPFDIFKRFFLMCLSFLFYSSSNNLLKQSSYGVTAKYVFICRQRRRWDGRRGPKQICTSYVPNISFYYFVVMHYVLRIRRGIKKRDSISGHPAYNAFCGSLAFIHDYSFNHREWRETIIVAPSTSMTDTHRTFCLYNCCDSMPFF